MFSAPPIFVAFFFSAPQLEDFSSVPVPPCLSVRIPRCCDLYRKALGVARDLSSVFLSRHPGKFRYALSVRGVVLCANPLPSGTQVWSFSSFP